MTALQQLRTPREVAELRGLSINSVLGLNNRTEESVEVISATEESDESVAAEAAGEATEAESTEAVA